MRFIFIPLLTLCIMSIHGQTPCVIFENRFSADWRTTKLCPEEMLRDLDSLKVTIEKSNPNPYLYCGKLEFDRAYQQARNILSIPRSYLEFTQTMSEFTNVMADSHTQILPRTFGSAMRKDYGRIFLPITKIENRYYLAFDSHGLKAGTEIFKINNVAVDSIFNIAADYVSIEGAAFSLKDELTAHVFSSILSLMVPLDINEKFSINVDENTQVTSEALDGKTYQKKRDAYFETILPEKEDIEYDIYPEDRIGVLKIHTFAPYNVKKAYRRIHRFFAWCHEYDLDMVIDLRNNGGGSADLVQLVYSYLDTNGYCTPNNVVWKSSELSQIPKGLREIFFPKRFEKKVLIDEDRRSYYHALRSPINTVDTIYMQHAKKSKLVCNGNVNVLINAGTASASVDFAHIIKERKRGVLIGTPCNGGMTGTWGNAKMYYLPITGIGYSISTIRYNYNREFQYDLNPIQPDLEFKIKPNHIESGYDILLEDLLENGLKEVR
ncbi:MAG: hypothetical protein FJX90_05205 [Bacteroidetes bacterium]|nr:hypothetical protein [Bacteroidota bacterium]